MIVIQRRKNLKTWTRKLDSYRSHTYAARIWLWSGEITDRPGKLGA